MLLALSKNVNRVDNKPNNDVEIKIIISAFLTDRKFRLIWETYKWHWYVDSEAANCYKSTLILVLALAKIKK
jgi:hypothetical protein